MSIKHLTTNPRIHAYIEVATSAREVDLLLHDLQNEQLAASMMRSVEQYCARHTLPPPGVKKQIEVMMAAWSMGISASLILGAVLGDSLSVDYLMDELADAALYEGKLAMESERRLEESSYLIDRLECRLEDAQHEVANLRAVEFDLNNLRDRLSAFDPFWESKLYSCKKSGSDDDNILGLLGLVKPHG